MDKIGNLYHDSSEISQPNVGETSRAMPPSSRRGVGHEWKIKYGQQPTLFGGGGHMDGVTALIQTFNNKQIEDEVALNGMGDDAMDKNEYARNQANANPEFNFSQYKVGTLHTQRESMFPGEGKMSIANTDGAASGDTTLRVNANAPIVDVTSQALGAIYSNVYKMGGQSTTTAELGVNPFQARRPPQQEDEPGEEANSGGEEDDDEKYDLDYYFDNEYHDDKAEKKIHEDFKTGLRRINTKTSQGRQLRAVATKQEIMSAYQEANDHYATVLATHMGKGHLSTEDRIEKLASLRPDLGKYKSSQVGVMDLSRQTAKSRRKPKNTKLNSLLVGV